MNEARLEGIPELVGTLLASDRHRSPHRTLFDMVSRAGIATAYALWRRVPAGDGPGSRWIPVLERGPEDALPAPELVRSVLEGEVSFELPHGSRVLWSPGGAEEGAALVLGEARCEEETLHLVDGLLLLASLIDVGEPLTALEVLEPALPARPGHPDA